MTAYKQYITGTRTFKGRNLANADMNDDGNCNNVYRKEFKSGEKVQLGTNGMTGNVINYTIFAVKSEETVTTTIQPVTESTVVWGDASNDRVTNIADAVLILQSIANPDKYEISEQGKTNADVANHGDGITASDALVIQQVEAGIYQQSQLPFYN